MSTISQLRGLRARKDRGGKASLQEGSCCACGAAVVQHAMSDYLNGRRMLTT